MATEYNAFTTSLFIGVGLLLILSDYCECYQMIKQTAAGCSVTASSKYRQKFNQKAMLTSAIVRFIPPVSSNHTPVECVMHP
jgi:hypothetical protein